MKTRGFTLIEVLVVVLIIGILTSVALPQYQKAVDKTHLAVYLPIAAKIRDAQNVYYTTYNKYAESLDNLDIELNIKDYCSGFHPGKTAWFAWNCKYGFGLDNYDSGKSQYFNIYFCPDQANTISDSHSPCWNSKIATITFFYATHPTSDSKISCTSTSKRGQNLCNQFK